MVRLRTVFALTVGKALLISHLNYTEEDIWLEATTFVVRLRGKKRSAQASCVHDWSLFGTFLKIIEMYMA